MIPPIFGLCTCSGPGPWTDLVLKHARLHYPSRVSQLAPEVMLDICVTRRCALNHTGNGNKQSVWAERQFQGWTASCKQQSCFLGCSYMPSTGSALDKGVEWGAHKGAISLMLHAEGGSLDSAGAPHSAYGHTQLQVWPIQCPSAEDATRLFPARDM